MPVDIPIEMVARPRFVSRGGEKLDAALDSFAIDVTGRVCLEQCWISPPLVLRTQSGIRMQIAPAAPRGWACSRDACPLETHQGLPGLLRSLRQELAPEAAGGRLIIGSDNR